jgi:hypothetical protein
MIEHDNGWREDRLTTERFQVYLPIIGAILAGLLISASLLSWGEAISMAILGGILVFVAAFLKPEWALIAIAVVAPLAQTTANWGTLLPGTGLTPINALALLLVIGTFLQRFSPHPPASKATLIDKVLLLYIGWSGFSVLVGLARWGYDSQALGEWVAMSCGYLLYWVVRRRWRSERLAVMVVAIVCLFVLYESYKVHQQFLGMDTSAFSWDLKERIVGTFPDGNSNEIACWLSVHCMIGLGLFLSLRNVIWRWAAEASPARGSEAVRHTSTRIPSAAGRRPIDRGRPAGSPNCL